MTVVSNVARGAGFARYCRSLIASDNQPLAAARYAAANYPDTPWVAHALQKSAVAPGTSTDSTFLGPFVPNDVSGDFVPLLRTAEVLSRIQGVRPSPFNTPIPRIVAGTSAGFRAEGNSIAITKASFDLLPGLAPKSVVADVVVSDELLRHSRPSADRVLTFDMTAAVGFASDVAFLQRTNAGSSSTPAAISYGAPTVASTGGTALQFGADLEKAVGLMATNGGIFVAPYLVMNPVLLAKLATKRSTTGAPAFPDLTVRGGSVGGIPALASAGCLISTGDTSDVVLLDAALVEVADEGDVGVLIATQATIEMATNPSTPPNAGTVLTSLWQSDCSIIRVLRYRSWQATNSAACVVITGVPTL